jgi:hypothetical protein
MDSKNQVEGQAPLPLTGKKLYSPWTVAAYTVLANIPVGCILYGLNLRARGSKRYGTISIIFGLVTGIALLIAALCDLPIMRTTLIGIIAAASVLNFEKAAFNTALRHGATRARWWPPALILLGVLCLGVLIAAIIDFILNGERLL